MSVTLRAWTVERFFGLTFWSGYAAKPAPPLHELDSRSASMSLAARVSQDKEDSRESPKPIRLLVSTPFRLMPLQALGPSTVNEMPFPHLALFPSHFACHDVSARTSMANN